MAHEKSIRALLLKKHMPENSFFIKIQQISGLKFGVVTQANILNFNKVPKKYNDSFWDAARQSLRISEEDLIEMKELSS